MSLPAPWQRKARDKGEVSSPFSRCVCRRRGQEVCYEKRVSRLVLESLDLARGMVTVTPRPPSPQTEDPRCLTGIPCTQSQP